MNDSTRPMSPWVRRALSGNLPIGSAGGRAVARDEEYVGVTPVSSDTTLFGDVTSKWAAIPVHPDDTLEDCSCGQRHRGWRHRD